MSRSILKVAALAAACTLFAARDSQAQEHPGMNMGNEFMANAAMDQAQMQWYWIRAQQLALEIPNNVSPAQLQAMMAPHSAANIYGGLNAGWHHNQVVQFGAVDRFGRHIRDEGVYVHPVTGMTYRLPTNPAGYRLTPSGWIYVGINPNDINNNLDPND